MIQLLIPAFLIGAIGSVHCVGMCGPLALSIPVTNNSFWPKLFSTLLYNGGRVFTYTILGGLFGTIGATFAFFGFQQWLSVLLGVLILFYLFLPEKGKVLQGTNTLVTLFSRLRSSLGRLFVQKNYKSLFFIGLLNGLLPCGLVYMAVAGAVATASIVKSSLFMAAFGLGTLPMMWGISFFGSFINFTARQKIRKAYPYIMALMACLLIIRGLGLGIPYISPAHLNPAANNVIECHK